MIVFIDVSGRRDFKEVRKACYSGIDLIIGICDLTRPESLENIENYWLPEFFQTVSDQKIDIQLIGNKCDLESRIILTFNDLHKTAMRITSRYPKANVIMPCLITSAKINTFKSSLKDGITSLNFQNYIRV